VTATLAPNSPPKLRVALAGLGKMGISHLAILRAHPNIDVVAVCDGLSYLTNTLTRYAGIKGYSDLDALLDRESIDALVIATPSRLHAPMVERALQQGLHVFCEKPFVLDVSHGERLVTLAEASGVVTQVGYHYRFVSAFSRCMQIVRAGYLGRVHHVRAEAHGPVVLRAKGSTWRSKQNEGGGVAFDYACHALDLVHFVVGPIQRVSGVARARVFSRDVDDEVYCTLHVNENVTGQLAANWSDESHRKMSTKLSIWGENGHIKADRQELSLYLREAAANHYQKGWTTLNTTELTPEVAYYLRGEEYSAQIDEFVRRIRGHVSPLACDFRAALSTDRVVAAIHAGEPSTANSLAPTRRSLWARLSGSSQRPRNPRLH
jgi:scyllo-inositol 2-dehydrogenase (NADP+)